MIAFLHLLDTTILFITQATSAPENSVCRSRASRFTISLPHSSLRKCKEYDLSSCPRIRERVGNREPAPPPSDFIGASPEMLSCVAERGFKNLGFRLSSTSADAEIEFRLRPNLRRSGQTLRKDDAFSAADRCSSPPIPGTGAGDECVAEKASRGVDRVLHDGRNRPRPEPDI